MVDSQYVNADCTVLRWCMAGADSEAGAWHILTSWCATYRQGR